MHTEQLVDFVNNELDNMKARDIVTIDVRDKASFTDVMVICSGNSTRHVKSIVDNLHTQIKHTDVTPLGLEGTDIGEWALLDLGDVIVHVMIDETRDLYQLEKLWGED
ncbi:ribosome silencing factor [Thalassotalea ponticola]|uniref:ribosome silencing factor n=1 Tax=Thalassotalea ponticola TaxID=1523392 RepID=UPI0025B3FE38|nr:ribosome silencing factor [Thalassotalea ponticola]MDN3652567.1 ribosome silencing factor [Thalassotalea ponticola]